MILWPYASTYAHFKILFNLERELSNTVFFFVFFLFNYLGKHVVLKVLKSLKLVCQGRTGNFHEYVLPKKQALKLCQCCNPYLLICYIKFERSYLRWS